MIYTKTIYDDENNILTRKTGYEKGDLVRVFISGLERRSVRSGNCLHYYGFDIVNNKIQYNTTVTVPIKNTCVIIEHELKDQHGFTRLYTLMWDNKFFRAHYEHIFEIK
jgi:hypothetical protein